MRSARLGLLLALLAGCSTGGLLNAPPARSYHSAKARDVIADCLMNRLASGDFRVRQMGDGAATLVRVTGAIGTYFVFTLTDAPGGGTAADMRRANSIAPGLGNAETCFDARPT